MPTPNTAIQRTGRRTIKAIKTMLHPRTQITADAAQGVNVQAKSMMVISSRTSHRPRVRKNHDTCWTVFPREVAKYAPVPARNENTGAQKWVMNRVKNNAELVLLTSSGGKGTFVM